MTSTVTAIRTDPAPVPLDVPVIVFAFDRPDYLARVLASLRNQRGVALDERRVFLLQDDAVSPRSGVRYADDAAVAASVATFREHFPRGHVTMARGNLGIARNIRRGEALAFESLDADCAYFFEDDLELGPDYLRILNRMRGVARADPRVGYFAAYGDHEARPPRTLARLMPLQHHWGFGLMREPWRRLRDWLAPYDAILARSDYAMRDHLAVFRWMAGLEVAINFSSQDAVKSLGCASLGIARVMTDLSFARYIGARGQSFSEDRFRAMGFAGMEWLEGGEYDLNPEVSDDVEEAILDRRKGYERYRRLKFDPFLADYATRHFADDAPVTEDDLHWLYRLLLGRAPDEGGRALVGQRTVRDMRLALLRSDEYRGRTAGSDGRD